MFNKNTTSYMALNEDKAFSLGADNKMLSGDPACAYFMKANRRCIVLINNYTIQTVDFPDGLTIENTKKAMAFKIKDFIDYPVEQCHYDLIPILDEQNKGKYYLVCINKTSMLETFKKLKIENIKVIDFFENALLNLATTHTSSKQSSLCIFDFGTYTYILLVYKNSTLCFRKIEASSNLEFDLWISEIQRSFDIFERQYRFTSIEETILVNIDKNKEQDINILLKNPKYIDVTVPDGMTSIDYIALEGLKCRVL